MSVALSGMHLVIVPQQFVGMDLPPEAATYLLDRIDYERKIEGFQ
jgi:hypothetical protein